MTPRVAQAADAQAICEIWNPLIRDTTVTFASELKTPQDVTAMIRDRGQGFWVAEIAQKVAGFATFGPFRGGTGYACTAEVTIHIAETHRGAGIGRELMTALEGAAHDRGMHCLVAGISGENPAAAAFHSRVGFEQVARMPEVGQKFGRWLDLVLMQKNLPCRTDSSDEIT